MSTDTVRLHYTYLIAILVLVGVFYLFITPTPDITGGEKLAFLGTVVGGVILFIFNRESAVGASRATERAVAQGANTQTNTPIEDPTTYRNPTPLVPKEGVDAHR